MGEYRDDSFWNDGDIEENIDHFSLKKLAKDVVTMGKAPVKLAIASVTGKDPKLEYETKVGKIVGGVHDASTRALTNTVKSAGDAITFGVATKAANIFRSEENKEKPFQYNEAELMQNTGIKIVDKIAKPLSKVNVGVGAAFGAGSLGKGAVDAVSSGTEKAIYSPPAPNTEEKLYELGEVPGDRDQNPVDQILDVNLKDQKDKGQLDRLIKGDENYPVIDYGTPSTNPEVKQASMFGGSSTVAIVIAVVVILLISTKK